MTGNNQRREETYRYQTVDVKATSFTTATQSYLSKGAQRHMIPV